MCLAVNKSNTCPPDRFRLLGGERFVDGVALMPEFGTALCDSDTGQFHVLHRMGTLVGEGYVGDQHRIKPTLLPRHFEVYRVHDFLFKLPLLLRRRDELRHGRSIAGGFRLPMYLLWRQWRWW
jgi:hypothetical protein